MRSTVPGRPRPLADLLASNRLGRLNRVALGMIALTLILLPAADLSITVRDPWAELQRMTGGLLTPAFSQLSAPLEAIGLTVAFALWGVALGLLAGIPLTLLFHRSRLIRGLCAALRAVHELFWALLFLQVFGTSAITALAAIAVPFAGIFAKVFAEILNQLDPAPASALPRGTGRLSRFLYVEWPQARAQLLAYIRYRFECAMRSSLLLGFVGLPTLGFHLESAFRQGRYHEAGAELLIFYLLIAGLPWWGHRRLLWLLLPLSGWLLGPWPEIDPSLAWRFVSQDIWPPPLLAGDPAGLVQWWSRLPALGPAIGNTLLLALMGTAGTLLVALALWPLVCRHFNGPVRRWLGAGALIVLRSTPEFLFAFVLLLLTGPSMLPAWIALALHNGALIAFLVARQADELSPGLPGIRGLDLYCWELLPRIFPGLLALVCYRAEVIMRETAILGILGVATLGFQIDAAFAWLHFDTALLLLIITCLLNLAVDALSRRLRPERSLTAASCDSPGPPA
ncbi:phosphonate transport system permease protein [Kushneria sinocarnis]|uniref:Phosphonate transport system permease protein n=1 Tax=Kushneria sinocarnis TaxID=595502 RepID=A0A420WX74_9GAMM|nr:ABC transporter permease [Kushneria sinocarnis]RKR04334.1 phosphonate transport system permease protein [Kushneria sinocarnis]